MMHVVKKMVLWYDYCVWKVMHMKCWNDLFQQEIQKPYYQELMAFLDEEYKTKTIFPPREDLFTCFDVCPYEKVKVVILGQDPYHQPNQAHGLCFSVRKGVKLPPSLRNIYKELKTDLDIDMPSHGYLLDWARQGVFMMNAVLSVECGKAGSHRKKGWEIFTDTVIRARYCIPFMGELGTTESRTHYQSATSYHNFSTSFSFIGLSWILWQSAIF